VAWQHPTVEHGPSAREVIIDTKKLVGLGLIIGLAVLLVPRARPALSIVESWHYYGNNHGDDLGRTVSTAGNVVDSEDGRDYADVVVGAPGDRLNVDNEGAVYVFSGGPQGLGQDSYWRTGSWQKGSRYGASVGGAGDVDGDGWDDLIVGAHSYNIDYFREGMVYLYCGPLESSTIAGWHFGGRSKGEHVGAAVGAAGDVNGDGSPDLLVSAWHWEREPEYELFDGAVLLFYGNDAGTCNLGTEPVWVFEDWFFAQGGQVSAQLGYSVGTAGDVNGDGWDDAIIGAPGYDGEESTNLGAAFVFYGSDSGLAAEPDWAFYGDQEGGWFGTSVSTAGDVNGDGFDDVVIGAPRYDDRWTDEGAAFVFFGSEAGLRDDGKYDWVGFGRQGGVLFGTSVSTAGDLNDDGWDDIIVGAPNYNKNGEGAAFVFFGSDQSLGKVAGWRVTGGKADTQFGYSVSPTGDVLGDGSEGIVAGAPEYKSYDLRVGKAAAFYGPLSPVYYIYLPMVLR
jgi:hypothetical protein